MTEAREAGLGRYLREAFTFRWNVLVLIGATGAALLSPWPDIALPLVAAGEMLYLAGLSAVPNFRRAIDAKAHAERRQTAVPEQREETQQSLEEMVAGLEPTAKKRFAAIRLRCLQMRRLASGVRGNTDEGDAQRMRTPQLDRLLWVFLRLLYSHQALARFLAATDEKEIELKLAEARKKLAAAQKDNKERLIRSLTDSVATLELRLDNYQRAESNAEFVSVELDRIEGKIQALTEMAVSHQDPDYISSQVEIGRAHV